jgi:hypothetical protein
MLENLLWGFIDGIIAWPTLVVNLFGGDYEVFQDRRGDGWYAFAFLIGSSSPILGIFGGDKSRRRRD